MKVTASMETSEDSKLGPIVICNIINGTLSFLILFYQECIFSHDPKFFIKGWMQVVRLRAGRRIFDALCENAKRWPYAYFFKQMKL